jgi:hypothetical protein
MSQAYVQNIVDTITHSVANDFGVCYMVDGDIKKVKAEKFINGRYCFDMASVKKALDIDMFEIVYVPNTDYILICDEEALLKSDAIYNFTASMIAGQSIVGNVMICHTSMVN